MPKTVEAQFQRALPPLHPWIAKLQPVVLIAGLIVGAIAVTKGIRHALSQYLLDVGVFQDAGRAMMDNLPLYSEDFPTRSGFRFIYPPFAAWLFEPLAWMGENPMEIVWTISTYVAVFLIVGMAVHRLQLRNWWVWSIGLAGLAFFIEPIRAHVMYGQINIFLILLVCADVLGYTPRKIRGIGIGVAAGIKITPAAYALIFLVRKDWWSLARSFGFFLLTAIIGAILRWDESIYFWTKEFLISDRGGAPPYPPNQALTGLIARLGTSNEFAQMVMKPGFLIIAALCVWGAWRFEHAGRPVHAFLLVIMGIVLATPLAVTHHWAGVVLLFPLVLRAANKWVAGVAVLSIITHYLGKHNVYPPEQPHYDFAFPQYFIGNAQGLVGLLLFVVLLIAAYRSTPLASDQDERAEDAGSVDAPGRVVDGRAHRTVESDR